MGAYADSLISKPRMPVTAPASRTLKPMKRRVRALIARSMSALVANGSWEIAGRLACCGISVCPLARGGSGVIAVRRGAFGGVGKGYGCRRIFDGNAWLPLSYHTPAGV